MNAPIETQAKIYYGWWIVAASFILLFLYAGAGFYSFSIFIQPLENAFGWSRSQISLAISIYLLVHGISAPGVGYLIERFEPKTIVTIFSIISGLAFLLVSFTQSLWYFYASYALLSIGTTGIGYIPLGTLLSRWFVKKRGTAIGASMVGLAVGGVVLAPVIEWIVSTYNWRVTFVVLGILVWAIAIPLSLLVLKKDPSEIGLLADGVSPSPDFTGSLAAAGDESSPVVLEGWPLAAAIRTRAFWGLVLGFSLGSIGMMGVLQHQVPLITGKGISAAVAASALGLTAGLGGLGKLGFGKMSDLIPFRYATIICYSLQAIAVVALLNGNSMGMLWFYVLIFGFSMGGIVLLVAIGVANYFGLASLGIIMGIVSLCQSLGYSSGAILSGLIYDAFGSYDAALKLYIGIYIIAILAMFAAGKPREYSKRE
jgi:MFS transporter, OFA family, oxalate/formate antiporter